MKKTNIMALSISALIATTSAVAGTEIDALKDRITELENNAAKVEISGAISVNYAKGNQTDKEIYVDEVEIGIATSVADGFNANIVFLAEVDDDADNELKEPVIDEVTIGGDISGVEFIVGKLTAPFGVYETAMISDSAGLEIGETGAKALVLSTEVGGVVLSAWSGSSKNRGFSIGYEGENFAVGIDTIRDAGGDAQKQSDIENNKGTAIHGQVSFGDITLIAEQITVENSGAADSKEKQLEIQYAMSDWTFAARRDGGDTKSNAVAVGYELTEGLGLTIENLNPKAAGEDTVTTANLTYEF